MLQQQKTKLLFYCHNVVGLGHIIRSVRIAEAAVEIENCECCIITGCRFLDRIPIDSRIRVVALPPVQLSNGSRFTAVNGKEDDPVMELRSQQIEEFARNWSPDAVLVDHNPLGLGGELIATLRAARRENWSTRFVWGIRDIQFSPEHCARMIRRPRNPEILEALEAYSGAIAYSDEHWIDSFEAYKEYGLPDRRDYVGIVTGGVACSQHNTVPVLVGLTGGGSVGERLLQILLKASLPLLEDSSLKLRFIAGPFACAEALRATIPVHDNIEVWPESTVEEAIQDASIVVSRVGYNTAYTLVQTDLPLVLVPAPVPGDEQGYRARLLAQLPGISVVNEQLPEAEELLASAIREGLSSGRMTRELPFRTDGAERAARWLMSIAMEGTSIEASDYKRG